MTWAQTTFAFCFIVLVPLFGFIFARRWKIKGSSAFVGFLAGSFLMFVSLVGCCFLAIACYPKYPQEPVSEWIANSFTLPAVFVGLAVLWFPRPVEERKRFARKCSIILLVVYLGGVGFTRWATQWSYRSELPWSATEIEECFQTEFLLPDFDYQLRAKISEAEFKAYVQKFKLNLGVDEEGFSRLPAGTPVYFKREGDYYMRAAYSDGYIYVEAGDS